MESKITKTKYSNVLDSDFKNIEDVVDRYYKIIEHFILFKFKLYSFTYFLNV